MASSEMLGGVALVRTEVSEEFSASFIRVTRIGEPRITLAPPGNRFLVTLMMEALRSSETTVLTRATPRNIPKDAILQAIPKIVGMGVMLLPSEY
jgi:hypothetical protein